MSQQCIWLENCVSMPYTHAGRVCDLHTWLPRCYLKLIYCDKVYQVINEAQQQVHTHPEDDRWACEDLVGAV